MGSRLRVWWSYCKRRPSGGRLLRGRAWPFWSIWPYGLPSVAVQEITESYLAPQEMWVVRAVVRKAMQAASLRFSSLTEAMPVIEKRINSHS